MYLSTKIKGFVTKINRVPRKETEKTAIHAGRAKRNIFLNREKIFVGGLRPLIDNKNSLTLIVVSYSNKELRTKYVTSF